MGRGVWLLLEWIGVGARRLAGFRGGSMGGVDMGSFGGVGV